MGQSPIQLNWRAASLLFALDPAWKRKLFLAGLVLLIPVVGWPALLGYRKAFIERLIAGQSPIMPEWRGQFFHHMSEGFKAVFVIFAYLSPIFIWFLVRMQGELGSADLPWFAISLLLLIFPIFSPLLLPLLIQYFMWFVDGSSLSLGEGMAMLTMYTAVTFFIPAGFLQVSKTTRFSSAFNFPAAFALIKNWPRRYCEAWLGSGLMSLMGHFAIPWSPWGVAWCYLGIVYAFNEVPSRESGPGEYLSHSWIARVNDGFLETFHRERGRFLVRYTHRDPVANVTLNLTTLRAGLFEIPIG